MYTIHIHREIYIYTHVYTSTLKNIYKHTYINTETCINTHTYIHTNIGKQQDTALTWHRSNPCADILNSSTVCCLWDSRPPSKGLQVRTLSTVPRENSYNIPSGVNRG